MNSGRVALSNSPPPLFPPHHSFHPKVSETPRGRCGDEEGDSAVCISSCIILYARPDLSLYLSKPWSAFFFFSFACYVHIRDDDAPFLFPAARGFAKTQGETHSPFASQFVQPFRGETVKSAGRLHFFFPYMHRNYR